VSWKWPGQSVASEVLAGSPPAVVEWLASWAHKDGSLTLEESTQEAWHRDSDRYRRRM
jgi:hypothetical protein